MVKIRNSQPVRRRANFSDPGAGGNYIRSQTISGYDTSGDDIGGETVMERVLDQKQHSRKKRLGAILVILCATVALLLFVVSQFTVNVVSVSYDQPNINGQKDAEYIAVANQYLASHPSERFSWSLRDGEFTKEVQTKYPEIAKVSIGNGFFSGGQVKITLRTPVAVWKSGEKRSYVDQNGVIFEKNFFDEPNIVISDLNNSTSKNGVSGRLLEFIGKTIAGIEASGVGKVKEVSIPATSARYVEVKLVDRNYPIKVQIDRGVDAQVTDIVNMVKFLDAKGVSPNYVDVRVKNRGYYK